MDGLDLLKQHWNTDENFPKVDKESLRTMLHKSSSSLVKWIFIISVIELFVGVALGFLINIEEINEKPLLHLINNIYTVVFYIIVGYFIFLFFRNYKTIKNTKNTKSLLQTILNTREQVNKYIKFNIYCILFSMFIVCVEKIYSYIEERHGWGEILFYSVTFTIASTLVYLLMVRIVKYYYKILYRRLIKKLDVNYEELTRLEIEA
ncbi:hypothetical protein E2P86_17235 [Sphingobacterium psychroaquaticum]|uniref:hypothetical protein n=1 Tax=Sphingobacterium psychroaquaticum TaxID=561061 RepID=UPI001068E4C5|nr:hypothetical protein [Sphingobacterium psychroaquaticum]QBQ42788.1 hypothetical protein E2P86_17235 [Sphingobacterium psychroaquaticum]